MTTARQALLAVLCVLAALGAHLLTPRQLLADLEPVNLEQMVPLQFGEWKALPQHDDVITSPEQEAFIKSIYSQTLSRVYADSQGHRIMLSIAYTRDQSDNSGTQSHKPEICYPAQGFVIQSTTTNELNVGKGRISARQLIASSGARYEPLSYWTMVGRYLSVSGLETKLAQIKYGLNRIIPDGVIFRVSTTGLGEAEAFVLQESFITAMANNLSEKNRIRLMGIDTRVAE